MNYYLDHDRGCVTWLENLTTAGEIPVGVVDGRSIEEVTADDLRPFAQVHLFAGIGGWPRALSLVGWPDTEPVWTVSCPCQPFSSAGKRRAESDERHLWPAVRHLVAELRPPVVFGEQVASRLGRFWLARVRAEMEALDYGVGAADLCAASAGAPHIRQRLWFVAVSPGWRPPALAGGVADTEGGASGPGDVVPAGEPDPGGGGRTGGLAHSDRQRQDRQAVHERRRQPRVAPPDELRADSGVADTGPRKRRRTASGPGGCDEADGLGASEPGRRGSLGGVADTEELDGRGVGTTARHRGEPRGSGPPGGVGQSDSLRLLGRRPAVGGSSQPAQVPGAWDDYELIWCRDGKARRAQPGAFPLADGVPGRVVKLRGYGNAIVPPLAATFVRCTVEAMEAMT